MANTPITPFRLDEETKTRLEILAQMENKNMTDVVKSLIEDAANDTPDFDKYAMIRQVLPLIKTDGYPHNETNIEEWIFEGDIEGMTAEEIAAEWDEVNSQ